MACGKGGYGSLHLPAVITIEIAQRKRGGISVCHAFRLKTQVFEGVKNAGELATKESPCRREGKASAATFGQRVAKLGFEGLDLLRYG